MNGGKIFLIIFGVFIFLIGLALMTGGGALTWANLVLKDSEGFYSTRLITINRDSYAVVTPPAKIDYGPGWVLDWGSLVSFKIDATNNDSAQGIFIGIARDKDVASYLSEVSHDEIREFRTPTVFGEPHITYNNQPGNSKPTPPTNLDFWVTSARGKNSQQLKWDVKEGSYSLVLMNEDGSQGINITGSMGLKIPLMSGLGIGLLVAGFIFIVMGFLIVYATITRSRMNNTVKQ